MALISYKNFIICRSCGQGDEPFIYYGLILIQEFHFCSNSMLINSKSVLFSLHMCSYIYTHVDCIDFIQEFHHLQELWTRRWSLLHLLWIYPHTRISLLFKFHAHQFQKCFLLFTSYDSNLKPLLYFPYGSNIHLFGQSTFYVYT